MTLSPYHEKYAKKNDGDIAGRAEVKREELKKIFVAVGFVPTGEPVRVAVLGCGERRFIGHHRRIFGDLLGLAVDLTTFDVAVEHLAGETGVIAHDITVPLPGGPYDIAYGHVVLKFIPTDRQWDVIKNAYDALRPGGIAIHVCDEEELQATTSTLSDGLFAVPIVRWKEALVAAGMHFAETNWAVPGPDGAPIKGYALIVQK